LLVDPSLETGKRGLLTGIPAVLTGIPAVLVGVFVSLVVIPEGDLLLPLPFGQD
jgi:hypothetical protein